MVKVTWISPFAPDRSGGGGHIRLAHLLLVLSARAEVEVELICPGPVTDPEIRAAVTRLVEVHQLSSHWREHHPWLRRAADLVASVVPMQPMEVRAFRPARRALRRAAPGADADIVVLELAGLAPLLPRRRGHRGRWVLDLHNLPSRMAAHQAAVAPRRRQRWLLERDARAGARHERRAAAAFDAVMAVTGEDAGALHGARRVLVVPNGSDVDRLSPTPVPRAGRAGGAGRVLFTGALYTTPNIDGARWFCLEVLPLIRAKEPTVEVDLVGSRPVEEVRALADRPGVTLHPDVATVGPYFESARVVVVPIRVGSGSRVKALEALAAGRPMVGTSIGFEGLGLRPGVHALVADDPVAFAAAVVRLLRDDALATALATAGRSAAEQPRFGWPAIGAAFADSILALAAEAEADEEAEAEADQPVLSRRRGTVPRTGRSL